MKETRVLDLMVPLSEYATVSSDSTLWDAIEALDRVHALDQSHYRHRAILVFDERDRVIGKLGLFDILQSLEGKYLQLGDFERLPTAAFSTEFIRSIPKRYSFWTRPLEEICRDAADLRVADIMHIMTEIEYISEEAPIEEAIHQLIMGRLQSLIVTRRDEIVGVLKLSDIFREISLMIRSQREVPETDQDPESSIN